MRHKFGWILATALTVGVLAGCSAGGQKTETTTAAAATVDKTAGVSGNEETGVSKIPGEAKGIKTGLAMISSMESSRDAGEKDGNAQVDSVAAAVVLDEDGRITTCVLDTAQNKMAFTSDGKLGDSRDKEFFTKKELKEDYGLKAASKIGKEWYEQAQALEEYVIGKTIEEIQGIAVTETTAPKEEDLASSVTIKIGDYVEAIVEAGKNARVVGTAQGDKLGLGIVTDMENSRDASEERDGQCQADSIYAAVTYGEDGVVTGVVLDATQGIVTYDAQGKITADLASEIRSKQQLKEEYGMKKVSGIGREWYEQADAMAGYVRGKTLEEIQGIAVREDGKTEDADLAASVTISIGSFQRAIEKAMVH